MRTCSRCGKDCSRHYVLCNHKDYCPECAEYLRMVKDGLGTQWTIQKTCKGCGAKLPYTGICEYCNKNNRIML